MPNDQIHADRPHECLISLKEVMQRTSLSRSLIYDKIQKGDGFPQPVRVGRRSAWSASEVDAWIRSVLAERESVDA